MVFIFCLEPLVLDSLFDTLAIAWTRLKRPNDKVLEFLSHTAPFLTAKVVVSPYDLPLHLSLVLVMEWVEASDELKG